MYKICRGKANVVDLGVTDDVTGQVKVKMFDDLEYLVLSRTRAVWNGNSQCNDMDRVWDTSKYHPKLLLSIFRVKVIQGHEVKEGSNWKSWVWVALYMFLGHFSVINTKNDPTPLFERLKLDKCWKSRKYRNRRIQRKKWPFSTIKTPKPGHFLRCLLDRVFPHISCFWKFENFPNFFWKWHFGLVVYQNFHFFEISR